MDLTLILLQNAPKKRLSISMFLTPISWPLFKYCILSSIE
eukprot:CAMPEP_0168616844 /NCGR_PEP_ID=MMETSP0449_2-20121227/5237_1 /TAXON_ID=1082188 /ORGANISM="Strombidium rassoulzadegani, Strain ras09" /LENGTH=39 /DNA_ID= /DNA_START= /DNA_END= /DNA_ORIENTATION=